ncbi:pyruvate dehydrogenase E1 component subunit alpha, mitochondrial [Corchorus olitorius]|uniref:Pyruvate dehydrogenase E1 component subunit alpha, mitochondrial n=1 Tax=Corchorus olitorius TaxID=93759 RepID=A0A1R3KMB1_9ROSI|nr:pyruvate dehydrogenase E1 component subunit alpha, mitochondrial [Corchorus olitorius]
MIIQSQFISNLTFAIKTTHHLSWPEISNLKQKTASLTCIPFIGLKFEPPPAPPGNTPIVSVGIFFGAEKASPNPGIKASDLGAPPPNPSGFEIRPAEVEWGHWVGLLQPTRGCQIGPTLGLYLCLQLKCACMYAVKVHGKCEMNKLLHMPVSVMGIGHGRQNEMPCNCSLEHAKCSELIRQTRKLNGSACLAYFPLRVSYAKTL